MRYGTAALVLLAVVALVVTAAGHGRSRSDDRGALGHEVRPVVGHRGPAPAPRSPRPVPPAEGDPTVVATHSLVKVRQDDPPRGEPTATISAARNEFEAFQLLLRSRSDLEEVDVRMSELAGPEGVIPRRWITVYRVGRITVTTPSSEASEPGVWPDPLVPRVDRYHGERRNAFPFSLEAERTDAIWIEVYVPRDAPAGSYRGEATVSVKGTDRRSIPVRLQVWPFTLPSTPTYATSFGISGLSILDGHHGGYVGDERLHELTRLYTKATLMHRISTHGGTMIPPPARRDGDRLRIDWSAYDREVGPFLDGTVLGEDDPLPGARATSVEVRSPTNLDPDDQREYWSRWPPHFRERGWLDRLFLYLWDEPQGPRQRLPFPFLNLLVARMYGESYEDYRELEELARRAKEADPRLRTAVTEQLVGPLASLIDLWIPLVNCLELKPGHDSYCEATVPRDEYEDASAGGPWFYQSCGSHSCDDVGGEYYSGWPSYMVDASAVSNRVMQWIAWRYRIRGELYHNMVKAYGPAAEPWQSVHEHGGNGDGTLFYPGRPDVIGGDTHIPVESMRLKLIRDGIEDYEYLALLAELGDAGRARELARRVAASTYEWDPSATTMLQARRELGDAIAALVSAP